MLDELALKMAQQRLQAVYDPQQFRAAAQQWGELLAEHLERVQQRETRVLNWAEPVANIAEAERWLDGVSAELSTLNSQPVSPTSFDRCSIEGTIFIILGTSVIRYRHRCQSPGCSMRLVPSPTK